MFELSGPQGTQTSHVMGPTFPVSLRVTPAYVRGFKQAPLSTPNERALSVMAYAYGSRYDFKI